MFISKFPFRSGTLTGALLVGLMLSAGSAGAAETNSDQPPVVEQRGPGKGEVGLFFVRDDLPELVIRDRAEFETSPARAPGDTSASLAQAITAALVAGPSPSEAAAGVEPFLPEGTRLEKVEFNPADTIKISLDFPAEFMTENFSQESMQEISQHFIESLNGLGIRQFLIYVKDHASGEFVAFDSLFPDPPSIEYVPGREPDSPEQPVSGDITPRALPTQNGFVNGALTGKRVVLNPSHGWYDNTITVNRWTVQRTLTWQVLEDFASSMFVNQYVIPMLVNAGAIVRPVREPDTQTNTVVMDNAMGAPSYKENGTGWISSSLAGYTHKEVYTGKTDNPFDAPQTSRLIRGVTGAPTHSAEFTPVVPASGFYNVYITYTAGTDRTSNAHWQVKHSGGITDFRVNQKITGSTWFLLGNFYFEKNAPASKAQIVALNDSGDTSYLSVDAVKIGGGMGNMARWTHGISGKPRWQEEATNYLQYNGMLNSGLFVNDNSNPEYKKDEAFGWSNRPYAARWEQNRDNLGNNLVYIGWHTNASTYKCEGGVETEGPGRGVLVIRDTDANASANTKNLTLKVRDGMLASVRASYKSNFPMRSPDTNGILASSGYGEAMQSRIGNVAGFFFEGLFHDNKADSSAYKDGKFRYAAARGIVNGLIQYHGGSVFPPEPVNNLRVKNIGGNQVRVEWNPGEVGNTTNRIGSAATGYRVFRSTNGYGFDNGTDVGNTNGYTMTLTPGELIFLRVSAVNSAGISIPSEALPARVATTTHQTLLLVNGFHRDDQFLPPMRTQINIGGCLAPRNTYREMDPRKYQSLNYSIQHAKAIASAGGYGIDSCCNDAVNAAQYNLQDYGIVVWIGGQQAEADTTDNKDDTAFRPAERTALTNFLTNGGRLMISGSELAWDFGRTEASSDKKAFLSTYLKAGLVNDAANTYNASGNAGIFAGVGTINFDNGSGNTYDVPFADVLSPAGGATACMTYSGGTGGTAAIQYAGSFGGGSSTGKLVYMGFPFETITNESVANTVMARVLNFFQPAEVSDWTGF